jgi:hypothetical protein
MDSCVSLFSISSFNQAESGPGTPALAGVLTRADRAVRPAVADGIG